MYSVESKQTSIVDDQCIVSLSTQKNEISDQAKRCSEIPPEMTETGKPAHQLEQSESDKSVMRCVIQKQTVIQEVLIVEDAGEAKRHLEVTYLICGYHHFIFISHHL